MKKNLKPIPKFKNEDDERNFWDSADSTEYIDWSKSMKNPTFPNLRFAKTISLRLPGALLSGLKIVSKRKDVPYQSYIKIILDKEIQKELKRV